MTKHFGIFSNKPPKCEHWFGEWVSMSTENRILIRIKRISSTDIAVKCRLGYIFRICTHCKFAEFIFDEAAD